MKYDLTQHKFGRLTAISHGKNDAGRPAWLCRCECGKTVYVASQSLRGGLTRSCGCLNDEVRRRGQHGCSRRAGASPEYKTWDSMIQRCTNAKNRNYYNYGGRGISVCAQWRLFPAFLADMGKRPAGKTLERVDNEKGYYPNNCKWATRTEQLANRRKYRRRSDAGIKRGSRAK